VEKTKPNQSAVTVKEVISGLYGTCPRCRDLCHLKPNYDCNRPQFKGELERMGERGKYLVDWHDYVADGRIHKGRSCHGSNAIPTRLVKDEPVAVEQKA